jgi:hypothetical protein
VDGADAVVGQPERLGAAVDAHDAGASPDVRLEGSHDPRIRR